MKIEIYKKENDENVYYTIDSLNERRLNFDSIKEISKNFLDKKKNNESTEYKISVRTSDLELYKTTLSDVINSILDDEELLKLYSENSKENISKDATVKQ